MPIEITTALIAFVGVILGLGVSFFLQALQRRWALDDQRREWIRTELEEYSEFYKGVAHTCRKIASKTS